MNSLNWQKDFLTELPQKGKNFTEELSSDRNLTELVFSCVTMTKNTYLVRIRLKNGYIVVIWQKSGYLVGILQKFQAEDASSCKNLPESPRILQDNHPFSTRVKITNCNQPSCDQCSAKNSFLSKQVLLN